MQKKILGLVVLALLLVVLGGCIAMRKSAAVKEEAAVVPPAETPIPSAEPTLSPSPSPAPTQAPASFVFSPDESFPPAPTFAPQTTPAPAPTAESEAETEPEAAPEPESVPTAPAPIVVKQPTAERRYTGGSAFFIAKAEGFTDQVWRAYTPEGDDVSMEDFQAEFPNCKISGEYSDNLTLTNLSPEMSNWSFFCVFGNDGSLTGSNSATLTVMAGAAPQGGSAQGGSGQGTASGKSYFTRLCGECGTRFDYDLTVCPNCGADCPLPSAHWHTDQYGTVNLADPETRERIIARDTCPECGRTGMYGRAACPFCGHYF